MASALADLKGLRGVTRLVQGLYRGEVNAQSFLLYGAEGSGKSTCAAVIAAALVCRKLTPEGPCGECQACKAMERCTNADVLVIEPKGPSRLIRNAEITDGDSDDGVIGLRSFLRTGPLSSRHKVIVIEEADRMNSDAANALLKTLEEPPTSVALVLTTRELGRLLPTVVSRCLCVACEIPESVGAEWSDIAQPSLGVEERLNAHAELFNRFRVFAHQLSTRPRVEALVAAEEFRALCTELEKAEDLTARQANAEGLALLSHALVRLGHPQAARATVDAHRRITGNAGPGLTFDAMFARLLNNQ